MTKTLSLAAASALCLSFISPIDAVADEVSLTSYANTGAIAIPLTTEAGELTDVAQQGFDVEATTDSSAELTHTLLSPLASALPQLASILHVNSETETNALNEEYELFSAPIAIDDPFAVAAMTWQSGTLFPEDATIEMRTLDTGKWSDWYSLDVEENCSTNAERCGSEYMISGSSTGIQARISHTGSALPADLRIDISYSASGDEDVIENPEITDILPPSASLTRDKKRTAFLTSSKQQAPTEISINSAESASTTSDVTLSNIALPRATDPKKMANIKTRAQWDNKDYPYNWEPKYVKFEGVIIHHTAGSNSYTQAQVPSILQGIYRYHAVTLAWGDIGYNVLIDKYGGRWEGRGGTLTSPKNQMVVGGHARPRNTNTMGISVMGDYTQTQPTSTVLTALSEVSAWKFIEAGIDPASTSPLTIPAETSTMKNQVGKPLNRIVGHKDVGATACPGSIYDYLGQIRQTTRQLYINAQSYIRLWGNNTFDTMGAIVSRGFSATGGTVVISTATNFRDALASNGIAGLYNAPILFTNSTSLPTQTKAQLTRLKPSRIIITGGSAVVSNNVSNEIKKITGVTPQRYWGQTAVDTANAIAKAGKGKWANKTAIVITEKAYQDGMSIGPYAYAKHFPIFYAKDGKTLTTSTLATMKDLGISKVYIIGGSGAVSNNVESQIRASGMSIERIWGQSAINTSQAVAQFSIKQGMKANNMGIATTNSYHDGLAAGPLLGKNNSVLVLTNSKDMSAIKAIYNRKTVSSLYIFGGKYAVGENVPSYLASLP